MKNDVRESFNSRYTATVYFPALLRAGDTKPSKSQPFYFE